MTENTTPEDQTPVTQPVDDALRTALTLMDNGPRVIRDGHYPEFTAAIADAIRDAQREHRETLRDAVDALDALLEDILANRGSEHEFVKTRSGDGLKGMEDSIGQARAVLDAAGVEP